MNQKMRIRLLPVFLVAALALVTGACQNKKPPAEEVPLPMDRVAPSPWAPVRPFCTRLLR